MHAVMPNLNQLDTMVKKIKIIYLTRRFRTNVELFMNVIHYVWLVS